MATARLRNFEAIVVFGLLWCVWDGTFAGVFRPQENTCSHTMKKLHDDVFYNVHIEPEHEVKKRSVDQPLRIHLYFDKSLEQLPQEHQSLVVSHVKTAVLFWESTLKVRATNVPIKLRRKCLTNQVKFKGRTAYCMNGCQERTVCGDITIPENHLEGCMYYNQTTAEYVNGETNSTGVAGADFILYIATISSKKCKEGQTIAYAAHCQQEQALDRPVAGYFSICPNSISSSRQNQQQLLSTMKHEILHALGFTASLYAFYRDDQGNPLTPRNPVSGRPVEYREDIGMHQWSTAVVMRVVRPKWLQKSGVTEKTLFMMVTPRVKAEVQKHFNCSLLEGAELEDQGIDGTVLTHWEKRVFENEAMTGTYTQNSVISRITLAMLEDTGWYKADYDMAGDYEWGRDLGCEFVLNSCYQWISTRRARHQNIHPFCDQVKRGELWTDCAHNRKSVALCNLVEYNQPLPPMYQYFDSLSGILDDEIEKYAGSVALADYCPYLQVAEEGHLTWKCDKMASDMEVHLKQMCEFSWTNENNVPVRGSNCEDSENNLDPANNFFGENYGERSLCFAHSGKWFLHRCALVKSPQHAGSGCYEFSCIEGVGLVIKTQNQTYRCYKQQQILHVVFHSSKYIHQGTIVCPRCDEVCKHEGVACPADRDPPASTQLPQFDNTFCRGCHISARQYTALVLVSVLCRLLFR